VVAELLAVLASLTATFATPLTWPETVVVMLPELDDALPELDEAAPPLLLELLLDDELEVPPDELPVVADTTPFVELLSISVVEDALPPPPHAANTRQASVSDAVDRPKHRSI